VDAKGQGKVMVYHFREWRWHLVALSAYGIQYKRVHKVFSSLLILLK